MKDFAQETVNILVVADSQSIQAGETQANQVIYMVDDNSPTSTGEGSDELVTIVPAGSQIVWRIAPINPAFPVTITTIHRSSAVDVFNTPPSQQPDGSWSAVLGNFESSQVPPKRLTRSKF